MPNTWSHSLLTRHTTESAMHYLLHRQELNRVLYLIVVSRSGFNKHLLNWPALSCLYYYCIGHAKAIWPITCHVSVSSCLSLGPTVPVMATLYPQMYPGENVSVKICPSCRYIQSHIYIRWYCQCSFATVSPFPLPKKHKQPCTWVEVI